MGGRSCRPRPSCNKQVDDRVEIAERGLAAAREKGKNTTCPPHPHPHIHKAYIYFTLNLGQLIVTCRFWVDTPAIYYLSEITCIFHCIIFPLLCSSLRYSTSSSKVHSDKVEWAALCQHRYSILWIRVRWASVFHSRWEVNVLNVSSDCQSIHQNYRICKTACFLRSEETWVGSTVQASHYDNVCYSESKKHELSCPIMCASRCLCIW